MTTQEEFHMIKQIYANGMSITNIAKITGRSWNTVKTIVTTEEHQPYSRKPSESKLDPYKNYILRRMNEGCLNAMIILDEIIELGYTGKVTILRDFMRPHRKRCKQQAFKRFETKPGEQAQVDWGEFYLDKGGKKKRVHAFVMVMGYSRAMYVEFVENEKLQTLIECHERAFKFFGGVPENIVYDNMRTVVKNIKAKGPERFNKTFLAFARHQAFKPIPSRAYHPQTKGKVESGVKYVRRNFWPRLEAVIGLDDLNHQIKYWLEATANRRIHGTTHEAPEKRLNEEPLKPRNETSFRLHADETRKVSSDCLLSFCSNKYSVPHKYAGHTVRVRDMLNGYMDIFTLSGEHICTHVKRLGKHHVSKNKEHFEGLTSRDKFVAGTAPKLVSQKDSKVHIRPLKVYDDMINSGVKS